MCVSQLLFIGLSYAKTSINVGLYLMLRISRVSVAKGRRAQVLLPVLCMVHAEEFAAAAGS